jgi:DNA-binding CsgD family transcriptional regulator
MTPRVAVIYYSATDNVHALADAIGAGAGAAGGEVRLRNIDELSSELLVSQKQHSGQHVRRGENSSAAILIDYDDRGPGDLVIVIHGFLADGNPREGQTAAATIDREGLATAYAQEVGDSRAASTGDGDRTPAGNFEAPRVGSSSSSNGRQPPAPALLAEADVINDATSSAPVTYTSLVLAAWRGQEARTLEMAKACIEDATAEDEGAAAAVAEYARAVLYNGLGRYDAAQAAAVLACEHEDRALGGRALAELVEASCRTGRIDTAASAVARQDGRMVPGGTNSERGILTRSCALLSDGDDADRLFREALALLDNSRDALQLARARLLYGEWLRRQSRRVDAREQLRAAYEMFVRACASGFAERARRELLATGETVRKRTYETRDDLTAQEAEIVRLAAEGHTNPEIGVQLFISPRTVEWHLRKVYRKLGISSRRQLRGTLADAAGPSAA